MGEITHFGTVIFAVSATVIVALLGMRVADRLSVSYRVVLFSVLVQGSSVPAVAQALRIPFRLVDHDLAEVIELVVRDDALASGRRLGSPSLGDRARIGALVRDGRPQKIEDNLVLQPGDHVHVYCQHDDAAALERIFSGAH